MRISKTTSKAAPAANMKKGARKEMKGPFFSEIF
jgi:hypothetical protein